MRHIAWYTLAILAAILLAAPASACINDSEVKKYEKEFKSSYEPAPPAAPAPSSEGNDLLVGLGFGMGGTFLLGAGVLGVVVVRGSRSRP